MRSIHSLVLGLVLVACSGGTSSPIDPPASAGALESGGGSGAPSGSKQENLPSTPPPAHGGGSVAATTPAPTTTTTPAPTTTAPAPPTPKLEVSASIISATLGDDCAQQLDMKFAPGICAPQLDDGTADFVGGCGFAPICVESNLQLSFKTGTGPSSKITITSVTLQDAKSGAKLDSLTASSPKSWNGNEYAVWDETLKPASDTKASYDLSAPSWSKVKGPLWGEYRLLVTVVIDGTTITLESTVLSREPLVAT